MTLALKIKRKQRRSVDIPIKSPLEAASRRWELGAVSKEGRTQSHDHDDYCHGIIILQLISLFETTN